MPRLSISRPNLQDRLLPLPASVDRVFIPTPSGDLELLCAEPQVSRGKAPIFFAHGGCGSAYVWLEWMQWFCEEESVPCYAVSYRGHGASWMPWFLRMYFTTKYSLANDLALAVNFVEERTGQKVVLVGHSSGGALSQLVLSRGIGDITVRGLALCAAMPCFGGFGVNVNWARMDPWMLVRMIFRHLGHPISPLSTTRLVKQAFFGDVFPLEKVIAFEKFMPHMESFAWPMGQILRFGSFRDIIPRIIGWGLGPRLLIMAAAQDRLVSLDISEREATEARVAYRDLVREDAIEAKLDIVVGDVRSATTGQGVRYRVIEGVGHHLQNDLRARDGYEALLDFYNDL